MRARADWTYDLAMKYLFQLTPSGLSGWDVVPMPFRSETGRAHASASTAPFFSSSDRSAIFAQPLKFRPNVLRLLQQVVLGVKLNQ